MLILLDLKTLVFENCIKESVYYGGENTLLIDLERVQSFHRWSQVTPFNIPEIFYAQNLLYTRMTKKIVSSRKSQRQLVSCSRAGYVKDLLLLCIQRLK